MNTEQISDRLWSFSANVGRVINTIPESRTGNYVAEELLRCSSSLAMLFDGNWGQELSNDLKQLKQNIRETRGWLKYAGQTEILLESSIRPLLDEADKLLNLLPEMSAIPGYRGLDHLAIAVTSTDEALKLWRDKMGFPVVCSEVVNGDSVRLTHLDLGNAHLQLVEPLTVDHPLQAWLAGNDGAGLHHFCFKVENIDAVIADSPLPTAPLAHEGTEGKRAVFLNKEHTANVIVEYTGV